MKTRPSPPRSKGLVKYAQYIAQQAPKLLLLQNLLAQQCWVLVQLLHAGDLLFITGMEPAADKLTYR